MIRKVTIKNPGCQFCKYYLESFKYKKTISPAACGKGARRIYEQGGGFGMRRWKWIDCLSHEIRNKDRFCDDFEVNGLVNQFIQAVIVLMNLGSGQTPTAFRHEKWWNDEKHK